MWIVCGVLPAYTVASPPAAMPASRSIPRHGNALLPCLLEGVVPKIAHGGRK